jgi:crotonobetainyl-CoA:carnitine CoA-transferase CaiB-like acyl-CoA transferase
MKPSTNAPAAASLPLQGVRVLDLTSVIMGPVCTQILADYGAEVVKVEPPEGDVMRHAGAKVEPGMGAMFIHANAGKRSVTIDLKQPAARNRLLQRLPTFDVLVHNVRPDAMRRLGLDYHTVQALHPSLIYVELTGYGEYGPYAGKSAFDDIIQAEIGLADLYARQNASEPRYVPTLIADRVTGITAAHATLASLYRRRNDGFGERITVSMFETMAAFVLADHLGGATFNPAAGPLGYSRLTTKHRRPYRTLDGFISVVVYNDKHWRAFFEATGESATFATDRRFQTAAARAENIDEIYHYLAGVIATRTTAHWLQLLEQADIPCSKVRSLNDLVSDPQLSAAGFFQTTAASCGHETRLIAPHFRAPTSARRHAAPAPRLGTDNGEILTEPGDAVPHTASQ